MAVQGFDKEGLKDKYPTAHSRVEAMIGIMDEAPFMVEVLYIACIQNSPVAVHIATEQADPSLSCGSCRWFGQWPINATSHNEGSKGHCSS